MNKNILLILSLCVIATMAKHKHSSNEDMPQVMNARDDANNFLRGFVKAYMETSIGGDFTQCHGSNSVLMTEIKYYLRMFNNHNHQTLGYNIYAALNRVMRFPYCEAIDARVYNQMQDSLRRPGYDYEFVLHYTGVHLNTDGARMVSLCNQIADTTNRDDFYRAGQLFGQLCDLMFG